ncbi:hypothetical protein [Butyricicoccus pullicaecorum]|uniref:hypothetical protein n=1 Tax=Butyricicoccus pullicaecorum TaxID=501571 RepID=UPI0039903D8D
MQELELGARVYNCLTRIGRRRRTAITSAEQTDGYRNKVQFPVQEQNGKPAAGFFAGKTHTVIQSCTAASNRTVPTASAQPFWLDAPSASAPMTRPRIPATSGIFISLRTESGQILVCITANTQQLPKKKQLSRRPPPSRASRRLSSPQHEKGNTVLGTEFRRSMERNNHRRSAACTRLSAPAFYQVNHAQAERLYEKAAALAGLTGEETVLDLYCGTGTITLCLARHAKKAVGVELSAGDQAALMPHRTAWTMRILLHGCGAAAEAAGRARQARRSS